MNYQQFAPHPLLSKYIDAYWTVRNNDGVSHSTRILPDGCIDIIINIGEEFMADNGAVRMKHERSYLVGTMTQFIDSENLPGTHLIGIRFKPLGFSSFYKFGSLHEIANRTIDIDKSFVPEIHRLDSDSIEVLNLFFVGRLPSGSMRLDEIVDFVSSRRGKLTVDELSSAYAMSPRQLERSFKYHVGVSPKEFINFKRYQYAVDQIRHRRSATSLLDIALDCGYYDHSHLTNEIRKYSGFVPSII